MGNSGYEKSAVYYDYFDSKDNIDFFSFYALEAGEALDIGAGTGRISIPLLRKGIEVYCVEPSKAMINAFREKIAKEPELNRNLQLVNSDATSFKINRKFKYAFMSGVFDHLLTENERKLVLRNIHRHLIKDGKFVFDIFIGLMKSSSLKPAGEIKHGNITIRRLVGSEIKKNNIIEVNLVYETYEKNKLKSCIKEKSLVGIASKEEIYQLLEDCNFKVLNCFSNYDYSMWDEQETNNLLIIEAIKS